jgi:hypothetical protein
MSHESGQRRNVATTTKRRVLTRYKGIAITAVLTFATEERPFVGMRKITQYARDLERDPKLARLPIMMEKALKTLVDQKMFKAKKDSCALTPCGRARAQGDMVQASTISDPKTSP